MPDLVSVRGSRPGHWLRRVLIGVGWLIGFGCLALVQPAPRLLACLVWLVPGSRLVDGLFLVVMLFVVCFRLPVLLGLMCGWL